VIQVNLVDGGIPPPSSGLYVGLSLAFVNAAFYVLTRE
jgi:hypothetical protein